MEYRPQTLIILEDEKMRATSTTSKTYTDSQGYKITLRLFEYGDGSNKVERWVYGPDGYYRPALSLDVLNVESDVIAKIKGEI